MKRNSLPQQGVLFRGGRKRVDSTSCRRENAVFPVRRKPPMWVRGNFHAPTSPRQSAQHPQGCISAPLLPRVLSSLHPLGAFFQILLCFRTLCDVIQEVLPLVLCHGFQFRHNAFHEAAKQENTVIALLALLNGQLAVEYLVSVFVLLQLFLCAFQFGITFLDGLRQFFSLSWVVTPFLILGNKKPAGFAHTA